MKYIVTCQPSGEEEIFLFPNGVNHDCMAEVLSHIRNQSIGEWRRINREVVSAGFVSGDNKCYGKSETLGVSSRPEDTELLLASLSM